MPLRPALCGETAERKVPSNPSSVLFRSWILEDNGDCTVATWTTVAQSKAASVAYTPKSPNAPTSGDEKSIALSFQGALWEAMHEIAKNSKLVSRYRLSDLKRLVQEQVQKSALTVHAVQEVRVAEQTPIVLNYSDRTPTFFPQLRLPGTVRATIPTRIDPDCPLWPGPLRLEHRQGEDQAKDVSQADL